MAIMHINECSWSNRERIAVINALAASARDADAQAIHNNARGKSCNGALLLFNGWIFAGSPVVIPFRLRYFNVISERANRMVDIHFHQQCL